MNNNENKGFDAAKITALVLTLLGSLFTVFGIIFLFVSFAATDSAGIDDEKAKLAFQLIGTIFSIMGVAFLIAAGCVIASVRRRAAHESQLKREGVCYEAAVVNVYENEYLRVNGRCPLVAECTYEDAYGKTYLVKSRNIWQKNRLIRSKSDFKARVWVNRGDPKDYYVEIYFESDLSGEGVHYDYDYR